MGPCLHSLHSLPFWPPDQSPGSSHSRPGCGHAGPEGKGKDQPRGSYRTGRRRGDGERHLHQDAPAPRKDIGPRRKLPGAPRQTEGGSEVLREVGPRELKLREAGKPASCPQAPGRPGGHATRQSNERHTSDKGPAGVTEELLFQSVASMPAPPPRWRQAAAPDVTARREQLL